MALSAISFFSLVNQVQTEEVNKAEKYIDALLPTLTPDKDGIYVISLKDFILPPNKMNILIQRYEEAGWTIHKYQPTYTNNMAPELNRDAEIQLTVQLMPSNKQSIKSVRNVLWD